MQDYHRFCSELQDNFGPLDPKGSAESELENLSMKDNQHISKYIVNFNRLAKQTGWDTVALRHSFYRGLPDRIKDQISQVGKPSDLLSMKTLAQSIDARYWERKAETTRDSGRNSAPSASKSPSNKSSSNNSYSKKFEKKTNSPSSGSPGTGNSTPKNPPAYADKLGKDGKLKPAERQRRIDNKLCMICGEQGHMARTCPKAKNNNSTPQTSGRAAATTNSETPAKESEK
jgi:hypothetical protein